MRPLILACVAVSMFGCSKSNMSAAPASDAPRVEAKSAEDPPTWTRVYDDVITPKCLPCHATDIGASRGQLDMSNKATAYANLVNAPSEGEECTQGGTRVQPGNAD